MSPFSAPSVSYSEANNFKLTVETTRLGFKYSIIVILQCMTTSSIIFSCHHPIRLYCNSPQLCCLYENIGYHNADLDTGLHKY